ncbi:hypothetical protein E2562_011502 [Oryza meyeriana var. granulata]|uniref:Uncharacterized protein n=1 Tax=Oryza meyeriana var. granulata TaxID=110450 RepID=A0A6G1D289_9ORYZ|nr:hypothetical protein E2562_011502 [Oryza meyeriana var. granulata]
MSQRPRKRARTTSPRSPPSSWQDFPWTSPVRSSAAFRPTPTGLRRHVPLMALVRAGAPHAATAAVLYFTDGS